MGVIINHTHCIMCGVITYLCPNVTKLGFSLWMHPANAKRCYIVTSSLIVWEHSQNGPRNPEAGLANLFYIFQVIHYPMFHRYTKLPPKCTLFYHFL